MFAARRAGSGIEAVRLRTLSPLQELAAAPPEELRVARLVQSVAEE
jgi:hypothetical protein